MEKIIERNLLYDFYGELLNEHQKQIYEDSAYQDLSLSELADTYEVSRQGIHDLLKRCDKQLMAYENKLHLISRFRDVKSQTEKIKELALKEDGDRQEIIDLADQILELL